MSTLVRSQRELFLNFLTKYNFKMIKSLAFVGGLLVCTSVCLGQSFQDLMVQMEPEGVTGSLSEIPVVFKVERMGGNPISFWSTIKVQGNEVGGRAHLPATLLLEDLKSVSMSLRLATGAPTKINIKKPMLVPMVGQSGIPLQMVLNSMGSSIAGRPGISNTIFGMPFVRQATSGSSYEVTITKALKFEFNRANRPREELIRMLHVTSEMADGARNDTDCKFFMETYNGQLTPLPISIRDGMKTDMTVRLNRTMLPSDFKQVHVFTTREKFEDGSSLPKPGAFESGDDMRFSLNLHLPGLRMFPALSIRDRGSYSTSPRPAQVPCAPLTLATHIAIWMETGEHFRTSYMNPILDIDLKGGKRISIPVVQGITSEKDRPTYEPYNVFSRSLSIPMNQIKASEIGIPKIPADIKTDEPEAETPLAGLPIHAIQKVTLKLVLTGSPREGRQEWDLKGLIIAAGRSSRFDLARSADWVPLYVNPILNKRFRASVDTGRVNDRVLEIPIDFQPVGYDVSTSVGR